MKIVVEEGDKIVALGDLKPGVYAVDGKDPLDCGIEVETTTYFPGTRKEVVNRTERFVLRAELLHVRER